MDTQLLEIHPRELKFIFEVKKQSSCVVHLTNLADQYVAFKVKTTSPNKYCVRPNVGIIKPKATSDFTVTMQAQRTASLECKDKFLIQGTVVPYGTTEEDITSRMFSRESRKYVEETKLRVVLTSAPNSPAVAPADGVLLPVNGVMKQEPSYETSKLNDKLQNGVENHPPEALVKIVEEPKNGNNMDEFILRNTVDSMNPITPLPTDGEEFTGGKKLHEPKQQVSNAEESNDGSEELRSKIACIESKLVQAEETIAKIAEEKIKTLDDNKNLKQELENLRTRKTASREIQVVGFPPLFVLTVALICLAIGFSFRS